MKIMTIATTAALSLGLVATGSIAASAAPLDSPAATSECTFGERLVAVWLRLPDALQSDLKDLAALPQGERADAAREIRDGALDGEYGQAVQDRAERVQARRIHVVANMPAELRSDLNDLRAADPADRRALAGEIADTALDGGYGEKTQDAAVRIQQSDAWQNCVAD